MLRILNSVETGPGGISRQGAETQDCDISRTIFLDAFREWKVFFLFWVKFHWSPFLWVTLTITQRFLDNGLAPNRRQDIIWTYADLIHWCMYVVQGGDELKSIQTNTPPFPLFLFHSQCVILWWQSALNMLAPWFSEWNTHKLMPHCHLGHILYWPVKCKWK